MMCEDDRVSTEYCCEDDLEIHYRINELNLANGLQHFLTAAKRHW